MSTYVLGVDGCKTGWLVCRHAEIDGYLTFQVSKTFGEVLSNHPEAGCIAVDIPIGLRDDGLPRACDVEARVKVGPGRRSSVFPAPARRLLKAQTFDAANRESKRLFSKGVSLAAYGIFPKVLEVDMCLPERQNRTVEVHPEVCFRAMKGSALEYRKKKWEGYEERRRLLAEHLKVELPGFADWHNVGIARGLGVSRDDVLDATAAAWTALRVLRRTSERLPLIPDLDERGMRMEIVY